MAEWIKVQMKRININSDGIRRVVYPGQTNLEREVMTYNRRIYFCFMIYSKISVHM